MATHPNRNRATKRMATAVDVAHEHEHDYSALLVGVRASFDAIVAEHPRLFLTDAEGLNDVYLDSLPAERQVHNCHACRRFLRVYGGLVAITEDGRTIPVMWDPEGVPDFYRAAFAALHARVKRARIASLFFTTRRVWGLPLTGKWSHMAVTPPLDLVYRERALTAGQAMAAARENFRTVATALTELRPAMLDEALRILEAGAVARAEKFIGPARWLRSLHDRPKGRAGENVLWRAIATAPEGYCHPKASVIGPLLDDILAGLPFDDIKARFEAKVAPLQYQRPQAAPTAGNIRAAEELVAKLGIGPSLERRFARLDELQMLWLPAPQKEAAAAGVFGHLEPKDAAAVRPVDLPAQTMTWEKFSRTILPSAEAIKIAVPAIGNFIGLTTAANPDAPPILKWDREDERNPVAWYVYPNGSPAGQWGLRGGAWATLSGICPLPPLWGPRPSAFLGEGVVLVIEGACDTREAGNALFPECLKEDLHAVRATIEAYSRSASIGGRESASACGYDVRKEAGVSPRCDLRVLASGNWNRYRIDRWD